MDKRALELIIKDTMKENTFSDNEKEIALKILNSFSNCKAIFIVGVEECDNSRKEIERIKRKLGCRSEDIKYIGIKIDEETKKCTYICSKKYISTLRK